MVPLLHCTLSIPYTQGMPTLSKTTKETKIILKWGGIFLGIIFLFLITMRFAAIIKEALTPAPPPAASFGKLQPPTFPDQQKENITYSLDTLTGFLPNFPDRIKVHKIAANPPNLLALDKTEAKVAQIGFTSKGTRIVEDIYQWIDQESDLQRRITINIFTSDFTIFSPYLITPSLQTLNNSNEEEEKNKATDLAQSFLSSMSLLSDDLDQEKTKTTLYSIEKSTLVPSSKIAIAKIARVDFFQKDLNSLPIYYEKGVQSTISFSIGKENDQLKVVDARYFHKTISEISSEYAIKSADFAFSELKEGKAYIASNPRNKSSEIVIKNVFLGYYIGETQQEFLMPVFVFIADDDFIAYVSAVKDEWINN